MEIGLPVGERIHHHRRSGRDKDRPFDGSPRCGDIILQVPDLPGLPVPTADTRQEDTVKLADHGDGERSLIEKVKSGIHGEPVVDYLLDVLLFLGLIFRLGRGKRFI
jgi:hypothetical protein